MFNFLFVSDGCRWTRAGSKDPRKSRSRIFGKFGIPEKRHRFCQRARSGQEIFGFQVIITSTLPPPPYK
jgi:hypothetical protein